MYNAGIITAGILGSGLVSEIIKAETESFQVELIEFSAYYDLTIPAGILFKRTAVA